MEGNMMTTYDKAYTEVLEIINHFPQEEYEKIPVDRIQFFKEHMDNDYEFSIDPTKNLSEQNISRRANAIIVALYRDYFATEKQKETLESILKLNERKVEKERRKKYNPDEIFKNRNR